MSEPETPVVDILGPGLAPADGEQEPAFGDYFRRDGIGRRRHFLRLLAFQTLWFLGVVALAWAWEAGAEHLIEAERFMVLRATFELVAWPIVGGYILRLFLDLAFPAPESAVAAAARATPFLALLHLGSAWSVAASAGMSFCAAVSYLSWREDSPRWAWWSGVLLHSLYNLPVVLVLMAARP